MSAQVISELFQQIVHSEEKIKQRFEALKKVNQDILEHQEKLRTVQYETDALQNNLILTTHKLMEEEIELKWLNMRGSILKEQEQESVEENAKLENEITCLEKKQSNERLEFLSDSDVFLRGYNLSDNAESALLKFEESLKGELKGLNEEHNALVARCDSFEHEKMQTENLRAEKEKLMEELESQHEVNNEMKEMLQFQKKELENTKQLKEKVSKKAASNKEWQSLTSELEGSKHEEKLLSEQHQSLATELYQMQQNFMHDEYWEKQLRSSSNAWSVNSNNSNNSDVKSRSNSGKKLFNYKTVKETRKRSRMSAFRKNDQDEEISAEELESLNFELHDDVDDSLLELARTTSASFTKKSK